MHTIKSHLKLSLQLSSAIWTDTDMRVTEKTTAQRVKMFNFKHVEKSNLEKISG